MHTTDFAGTSRFEIVRRISAGGMGVVYEAQDRMRNERIALKTLTRLDAALLFRLKSEFRILQDLYHPNLIRLGQLYEESGSWFFTMELIEGQELMDYVRGQQHGTDSTLSAETEADRQATLDIRSHEQTSPQTVDISSPTLNVNSQQAPRTDTPGIGPLPPQCDIDRLRKTLSGIVSGLYALHSNGVVHCDVKPGNIMIGKGERVVLLDFGLAHELERSSHGASVLGTPAYMAPEQANAGSATTASDWYALGVTLFEALTGRLPFEGKPLEILEKKQNFAAPRASQFTDVPHDLDDLCQSLLEVRPERRPSGGELLKRIADDGRQSFSRPLANQLFVGRTREIAMLGAAMKAVKLRRPVLVHLVGESGLGKTALTEHFLESLRHRPDVVVLRGRCFEHTSVPFKGLDHFVDQLSYYLSGISKSELKSLLPEKLAALLKVFPVLQQVSGIRRQSAKAGASKPAADLRERQAQAHEALRQLIQGIAERRRLIISLDDMQWSDADSTSLLASLLSGPEAPGLLLLASYRPNEAPESVMRPLKALETSALDTRRLVLEALSREESFALARELITERRGRRPTGRIQQISEEVGGNPLVLSEIARHVEWDQEGHQELSLGRILQRRIDRVSQECLRIVEILAVLGRPVSTDFALHAAGLGSEEGPLLQLASDNIVHLSRGDRSRVELFHQRLRDAVYERLSSDQKDNIYAAIAAALDVREWPESGELRLDLALATESPEALSYLLEAATQAETVLAFERASELYRHAVEHSTGGEQDRLRGKLAEMLELAGHGAEAAAVFTVLASVSDGPERNAFLQRAADNLLRSGHIDEGLSRLAELIESIGIKLPRSRTGALSSLLRKRIQLSVYRGSYHPKKVKKIDPGAVRKLDTMYAASSSLGMIDHLRGTLFQSQCLLWALRSGDESRVCRALATEIGYLAAQGKLDESEALGRDVLLRAKKLDDEFLMGGAQLALGIAQFFGGRLTTARTGIQAALEFLESSSGAWWERNTAEFFLCVTNLNAGDFLTFAPTVKHTLQEAERRNDAYMRYLFSGHPSIWCAMRDDDIGWATDAIDSVMQTWPSNEFYQAHYSAMACHCMGLVYAGDGEGALQLLDDSAPMMKALLIHKLPFIHGEVLKLRARAALLQGDQRLALKNAEKLSKNPLPLSRALAALVRAAACRQSNPEQSERFLAYAKETFEECGAAHLRRACDYQLGILIDGRRGDELSHQAIEWFRAQGVASPERMIAFLAPGFS